MNGNTPAQDTKLEPEVARKIIIIVLIVIAVITGAVAGLRYFKVVNIGKPPIAQTPSQIASIPPEQPTKLVLPCPTTKKFCSQAKPIIYKDKTLGLGFTLPRDATISAVFPGTLENGTESGGIFNIKSHPVRWLHGQGKFTGLVAGYSFFGAAVSSFGADKLVRPFTERETIATTSANTFPAEAPFNGVSLIFSVTKGDKFGPSVNFSFEE